MQQETALKILKSGRNVFLTGAAGAGKTHVLNQYITWLHRHRIPVGITASTGIAATHIGGQTIHSWSGIGIKEYLDDWSLDALGQKQKLSKRLEHTQVLIIDEVSMLGAHHLTMVDQVARALRRNPEPFGGMQIVLTGDFFQLPPVSRDNSVQFAYVAPSWNEADVRVCYLSEQHRHDDPTLTDILNELRGGEVSTRSYEALTSRMGATSTLKVEPTRLFSHNTDVDARNERELAKLTTTSKRYDMTSRGRAGLIASLKKSMLTPETLIVKEGAAVMFVKNDPEGDFVNGTLGTVIGFEGDLPVVRTARGTDIIAEPMEWKIEEDGKVLASVTQVPLRLAWAITIHKSQGMSLDAAEIDLSKTFTPGQGYVALSRVRTLEGLMLRGLNDMALRVHEEVARHDHSFRSESDKWERVVSRFSDKKIAELSEDFITRTGGSLEAREPEAAVSLAPKVSTYEKTRRLLDQGKNLAEIARERGMTKGTIIGHLETLLSKDPGLLINHLKPDQKTLNVIIAAFEKHGAEKLAPVHSALKGKYSYDTLRLARLFFT